MQGMHTRIALPIFQIRRLAFGGRIVSAQLFCLAAIMVKRSPATVESAMVRAATLDMNACKLREQARNKKLCTLLKNDPATVEEFFDKT